MSQLFRRQCVRRKGDFFFKLAVKTSQQFALKCWSLGYTVCSEKCSPNRSHRGEKSIWGLSAPLPIIELCHRDRILIGISKPAPIEMVFQISLY